MKNFILFLMLLVSVPVFSQKKGKVDPKDLQIDSLTQVTVMLSGQLDEASQSSAALSMKLDSVSMDRDKYYGSYKAMRDKVVKYNFDPARTSLLIDSLKMNRDSILNLNKLATASLNDSIKVLAAENAKLQSTITAMAAADADKEKIVAELKQLKELLDSKIITQEEYDAKKTKLMAKW
ncbi:MAG TPA: SHOCT domain-containing protein [Saprospiraceae bacterium]|nr:SHOCT domain-containing protein [Saprospiraceae bacterium]